MKRLLYIAPHKSSFVLSDIKGLRERYVVNTLIFDVNSKFELLPQLFLQLLKLLFLYPKTNSVVISSAGYWSIFPVLLGKLFRIPVHIILNGSECANIPSINFGTLRKPSLKKTIGLSLKYATSLLPVSETLLQTELHFGGLKPGERKQGILHHFPNLETKYAVIPNGFDPNEWPFAPESKIPLRCIAVFSNRQFHLKGGDLLLEVAGLLPNFSFVIAGMTAPNETIPENVSFIGKIPLNELKQEYAKSQFHFQLSIFEGFGCALAEAMLCGCTPIGSSVNSIPTIIGSSGLVIEKREAMQIAKKILTYTSRNGDQIFNSIARERIINNYSLFKRIESLSNVIETEFSN